MTKPNKFNDTFHHTETALIMRSTEKFVERTAEDEAKTRAHLATISAGPDSADPFANLRKIDGFYAEPKLVRWCEELRKVNPRLKFGMRTRDSWSRSYGPSMMHEVWAYIPEQPYAIMRLGYKDYRTSRDSGHEPQYGVYSRLIENNKYNCTNEQYAMSMTGDFDRAVAMAKKYLRPYAPHELIQVQLGTFRGLVHSETSHKNSAVYEAINEIRKSSDLLVELRALYAEGYQFRAPALQALVSSYLSLRAEQEAHNQRVRHGWFVSVYERNDKQYFDVIEMFDVHKVEVPKTGSPQTYDETTLPDELSGKLSVLMMNDKGHRVPDVGMRATDRTFYVERE